MSDWDKTDNGYYSATTSDIPTEMVVKEYTTADLWQQAWSLAGKSLFYMEFIHPNTYLETDPRKLSGRKQLIKVKQMCYQLAAEWNTHFKDTEENRNWFRQWIEAFEAETENQC